MSPSLVLALSPADALAPTTLVDLQHTFASFLSRDTTYDLIGNIWRMIHPVIPLSAALPDALSTSTSRTGHEHESDDESSPVGGGGGLSAATAVSASGVEVSQSNEGVGSRAKRRLKGLRKRGGTGESAQGGKAVVDGGVRSSPGGGGGGAAARASGGAQDRLDGDDDDEGGAAGGKKKKKGGGAATPPHAPTTDSCPTLKNLKEVCMDAQFPGAPEKIYNLMFTSGFMKGFWAENQKLMGASSFLSFFPRVHPLALELTHCSHRSQRSRSATGRLKLPGPTSSPGPCRTSSRSTARSGLARPSASSRTSRRTSTLTTLCASSRRRGRPTCRAAAPSRSRRARA